VHDTGSLMASADGADLHRRVLLAAVAKVDAALSTLHTQLRQFYQDTRLMSDGPVWHVLETKAWLEFFIHDTTLPALQCTSGSVAVVSPSDMVGTKFERVVFLGVDLGRFPRAQSQSSELNQSQRSVLNKHLGVRFLQTTPMTGRGALAPDSRDWWLWHEVLAASQAGIAVSCTVEPGTEDEGMSPCIKKVCCLQTLFISAKQGLKSMQISFSGQSFKRFSSHSGTPQFTQRMVYAINGPNIMCPLIPRCSSCRQHLAHEQHRRTMR